MMKWLMMGGMVVCLVACQREEPTPLVCEMPQLGEVLKNDLNTQWATTVKAMVATDTRQYLDGVKAVELAYYWGLQYTPPQAHATQQVCQTELRITLADAVWKLARENAPLLNATPFDEALQQRLMGSRIRLEQGELVFPIQYTLNTQTQPMSLTYQNTDWASLNKTLALVVAPYAVRERLLVNGQMVSRQQALSWLSVPHREPSSSEKKETTQPEVTQPVEVASLPESPTEVLQPNPPAYVFNPDDLPEAQRIYNEANAALKQAWQVLEPSIRQSLHIEQQQWEKQKDQNCRRASQTAKTQNQANYLYMQCDTRMSRERIQYLRTYSLPE